MKFKFDIEFQPFGEYYLAVPVGVKSKDCIEYIRVNETCYFIASRINMGMDDGTIIDEYMREYVIGRDVAERDYAGIVDGLKKIGFCED